MTTTTDDRPAETSGQITPVVRRDFTGDEVEAAMKAAGIARVEHHACSLCGYMTSYVIEGGRLYFDSGCNCSWGGWRPAQFDEAADWINMQDRDDIRAKLAAKFGLTV